MVIYTFFLAKIQCRCKTLKAQLIEELFLKNQNEKNSKKAILESMQQGVALVGEENDILYMNNSIKKTLTMAISQIAENKQMLDQYVAQNASISFSELDFTYGNFLEMKVFEKKINEEDVNFGAVGNSSSLTKYSFNDLIYGKQEEAI
jgi:transcriptional regulator with PAS, ATPase and Fis domain